MRPLLAVLVAYALGCVVAAYYVVRLRTGTDVRDSGSGNAGARNVYRSGDRVGAALTFALDAAKGAAAIQLAIWAVDHDTVLALAFIAVIAGHIWPVQLQFRGGKGVAPAIGAGLVLLPRLPIASVTLWLGIAIGTALVVLAHQRKRT